MHYTSITSTLLFILIALCPHVSFAKDECAIAREAIKKASVIRKLPIKKEVPCKVHTKEEVTKFVTDTVDTKIPPAKLHHEEVLFKLLGLIPDSFSYAQGIVDLYVSQIGGYYDPDKHYFVMAGWLPEIMQPTIAAHELTHALQDQYYDLSEFISPKSDNSDEQLARSALVEGDATAVMMDYMRSLMGQKGLETESSVDSLLLQNVVGASFTSAASGIPTSLQNLMIFPYTSGLRFAHTLLRQGSYKAIDGAFKRPPRSTEEILHPEKYTAGATDFIVITPAMVKEFIPEGSKIVYYDTVGEFGISTLLGQSLSDKLRAVEGAKGWGGDKVFLVQISPEGAYRAVWRSHWDSVKESAEFEEVFIEALKKRFPDLADIASCRTTLCPVNAKRSLQLVRSEADVTFVIEEKAGV